MGKLAPMDSVSSYVHLKKSTVHHGASVAALLWNCEATGEPLQLGWVQTEVLPGPAVGPASKVPNSYLTPFETLAPFETGMRLYTFCAAMEWGLVNHVYCFDAKRCSVAGSSR